MKLAVIAGLLLTSFAGGAANAADKYINIEANTGVVGGQVGAVATDAHVGIEGTLESGASWYAQAGPMITTNDGTGSTSLDLAKSRWIYSANSAVDVYGELSFAIGDMDTAYGALGKFKFRPYPTSRPLVP